MPKEVKDWPRVPNSDGDGIGSLDLENREVMDLGEDYIELMSSCRVTCLPTLSEGYSWTILDAMCLGIPVVTTTECHCSDLFQNGPIGIRTTPTNTIELRNALVKMLDNDTLCKKSSRNGLRKRKYYDYKKIIPQYMEIYNDT